MKTPTEEESYGFKTASIIVDFLPKKDEEQSLLQLAAIYKHMAELTKKKFGEESIVSTVCQVGFNGFAHVFNLYVEAKEATKPPTKQ